MIKDLNNRSAGIKAILLLFAFLLVSGCVTPEEKTMIQWDLRDLKADVKKMKQKSKSIETQFPGQQKQFNAKILELEERQQAASKTVSDLLIQIQYLSTEVQMLTGRFEEASYNYEKSSAEVKESKKMFAAQIAQLEVTVKESKEMLTAKIAQLEVTVEDLNKKLTGVIEREEKQAQAKALQEEAAKNKVSSKDKEPKGDVLIGTEENALETEEKGPNVKDAYMSAYKAYKEERTVEAREKFRALLMDYSENEYSDNARFWIAESYYRDGSFEDAILAYEELFRKNPESDKVPGAMLKQGMAFYALKDKKTGRLILEKLVDKFPESDQAKLAIKKMKKATVPPKKK